MPRREDKGWWDSKPDTRDEMGHPASTETQRVRAPFVKLTQPASTDSGWSSTASCTAYCARRRVVSRTGSEEFSSEMMSGISVHPRITQSAPIEPRDWIVRTKR